MAAALATAAGEAAAGKGVRGACEPAPGPLLAALGACEPAPGPLLAALGASPRLTINGKRRGEEGPVGRLASTNPVSKARLRRPRSGRAHSERAVADWQQTSSGDNPPCAERAPQRRPPSLGDCICFIT